MNIELRLAQATDYLETENITREAFWNQYVPGCSEHYLIHIMRNYPAFLHKLDIVALHNGRIVGTVVSLQSIIKGDDGKEHTILSLGPIAVLPEYQGKGIGGKLIAHTKDLARAMGQRAIFLYGDPDYYLRQGFVAAEQLAIRTADNMYATAHHGCELYKNSLSGIQGRHLEDAIYQIDEVAASAFDTTFPVKEKVYGTPSQQKFEKIVAMRRNAF